MAFETISTQKKYFKLADCTKGEVLTEGHFLRETVSQRFNTRQFEFRDVKQGIVVLGGGSLAAAIDAGVNLGDYVRVTYNGMEVIQSGNFKGSQSHQFIVEVDKERSAEPIAEAAFAVSADQEETVSQEEIAATQEQVAEATAAASAVAESAQSTTSAILSKYKKA